MQRKHLKKGGFMTRPKRTSAKSSRASASPGDTRGWQKEKKEHPWATEKQAKRIAADHNRMKK